jgi:hypothetical protein
MNIGWIGGMNRAEADLVRMAHAAGHHLDFHNGNTAGRGAEQIESLVERSDFVIIVTELNSHNGVILARKMVRKHDRGSLLTRRFGAARFQGLLDALESTPLKRTGTHG